jgi:hypothetical protein
MILSETMHCTEARGNVRGFIYGRVYYCDVCVEGANKTLKSLVREISLKEKVKFQVIKVRKRG